MSKFKFTIDGKEYEVSVTDKDKNVASVEVNGKEYTVGYEAQGGAPVAAKPIAPAMVSVTAPQPVSSQAAASTPTSAPASAPAAGGGSIVAPLPGTISSVAVSVGASVKRGDLLLVMEAMKMENDIRSDRDGVVKAIHVAPGKTVMQGDVLLDIA